MVQNGLLNSNKLTRPEHLSDQVASFILEAIDQRQYQPGDRLPSEAALAKTFGVSRTVIREALARLKYDGILESRQGQGVLVNAANDRRAFRLDDLSQATAHEANHLFELRAILECDSASLAAQRRDDLLLERMQECLTQLDQAILHKEDGAEPDFDFHHLVVTASRNPYLIELMDFLHIRIKNVIRRAREVSSLQPGLPEAVQTEHVAIYDAIQAQHMQNARDAMLNHILKTSERLGLCILRPFPQ
ncbi:MAG: FadR/GntR family transcriptional regulator [Desulfovermiculus sp.]